MNEIDYLRIIVHWSKNILILSLMEMTSVSIHFFIHHMQALDGFAILIIALSVLVGIGSIFLQKINKSLGLLCRL
jgi:hypothetical protein